MEALSFMKMWLSNANGKPRREIRISDSAVETPTAFVDQEAELCEEDSFFELEISVSDFSLKTPETFSLSKSKVLPFSFNKSKPVQTVKSTKETKRSLNVRFRIEDYETTTSFRKTTSISRSLLKDDTVVDDSASSCPVSSSSKRFFSLLKPLYTKTTKKRSSNSSVSTSPASSPAATSRRQLGKSRSASAVMSPPKRVDESLQVQQDGIQSAILHCKKSFHGSRESSLLSRSTSESSSQEKLSTSSSEGSYMFSRTGSDSMSEKSIDSLTSIKEQREKMALF